MKSFMQNKVSFIETSWKNEKIGNIVKTIANRRWSKAAFAHLTTFAHAQSNGYSSFLNIDADDTCFCLKPERVVECLKKVENYARNNNIKLFSLDMHVSDSLGEHWSYGITYTDSTVDWIRYIESHMNDERQRR